MTEEQEAEFIFIKVTSSEAKELLRDKTPMDRDKLLDTLKWYANKERKGFDREKAHEAMDMALLKFIDDEEVTKVFLEFDKWYS